MGQRFLRHERRLRHRTFDSIDQQHNRIDHGEHALDLAAEIRVTWGVDDIDAPWLVVRVSPANRGILRQNGNPALFLDIAGVHDALFTVAAFVQRTGLPQQLIDERRFTVVNVGHDGNVTKELNRVGHGKISRAKKCCAALSG